MKIEKGMVTALVSEWEKFYKKIFNIEVDLSQVIIPKRRKGFGRLIIVIPGMTPQKLFDKCKEQFPVYTTAENLNNFISSERIAESVPYAIWVRNEVQADQEELRPQSISKLKREGILMMTLEERLLYELMFYSETGKHLDTESSVTLCVFLGDIYQILCVYTRKREGFVTMSIVGGGPSGAHNMFSAREVIA